MCDYDRGLGPSVQRSQVVVEVEVLVGEALRDSQCFTQRIEGGDVCKCEASTREAHAAALCAAVWSSQKESCK